MNCPKFLYRYFPLKKPFMPALGELNLTWTLGSNTETLPYSDPRDDGTYNSVVIRLQESSFNDRSATFNALNMLHEALHAKLIAEFYDQVGSTDFDKLFAFYKGFGPKDIDMQQELEMYNLYTTDLAMFKKLR